MATNNLNNALLSAFKMNPQLREMPSSLNRQIGNIVGQWDPSKSEKWNLAAQADARAAIQAGLPNFPSFDENTGESASRLRLKDAIARSEQAGFKVPHFIGIPNEPTGDRGMTMDLEELVKSLQSQEQAALKSGNKLALDKISREKSYWQNEASKGMSAEQWKRQTGEDDPQR